jgi:hypothetical protein
VHDLVAAAFADTGRQRDLMRPPCRGSQ